MAVSPYIGGSSVQAGGAGLPEVLRKPFERELLAMRISYGWMAALFLVAYLPTAGCKPQSVNDKPAGAGTAAEDHDHDHADAEHAHEHGDEHADEHAHEHGDHDHAHADEDHAHPETYAGAVAELEKLLAAVKAASAGDDSSKADDDVHEIGHLLEEMGALAAKEPLTDEAKGKISAAIEALMDAFEQIDAKIHGGTGKAYAEVADKIDAGIAILKYHVAEEK